MKKYTPYVAAFLIISILGIGGIIILTRNNQTNRPPASQNTVTNNQSNGTPTLPTEEEEDSEETEEEPEEPIKTPEPAPVENPTPTPTSQPQQTPVPPAPVPTPEPTPTPEPEPVPQPEPPKTYSINIQNMAFSPSSLTIKAGDTVVWTNSESISHTATGSTFDSGTLSKGGSFSFTFTQAGTFSYICSFHPGMSGQIIVL